MKFVSTRDTVPFALDLILGFDPNSIHDETPFEEKEKIFDSIVTKVNSSVDEWGFDVVFAKRPETHSYVGAYYRPGVLFGVTDLETFKELFGPNLGSGYAVFFPPKLRIPRFYVKWHQTGELIVPEDWRDVVKGVYLNRRRTYDNEKDLTKPRNAKDY